MNYDSPAAIGKMLQQQIPSTVAAYQPSIREVYAMQLQQAQQQVSRLQELLDLLDKNPDAARLLELTGRGY